jgi:hypothetical protein
MEEHDSRGARGREVSPAVTRGSYFGRKESMSDSPAHLMTADYEFPDAESHCSRQIYFAHPTRADLGDDPVMRQIRVG